MYRENTILLIALFLSIGLHVAILPLIYMNKGAMSFITAEKIKQTDRPLFEDSPIDLGIDNSKVSTLTWIGYEEYEEQLARHAEVEQASMQSDAAASAAFSSLAKLANPLQEVAAEFLDVLRSMQIAIPSRTLEPSPQKITQEVEEQVAIENPVQENTPTSDPADRDAEATSIIRVLPEDWKAGKPLAGKGIVLKPKKPAFTPNQLVASRPSNLVADLYIDKSGKPLNVVVLLGTGGASIDRTIENSLYRWRASGEQVEALQGEDTVKITIHILFSR
ncbi:MAG: hypothetical protein H8E86_01000 [Planctomycetes bacterium]|nr:hypothetical protein [Planctomycetota bacterium]